MMIHRVIPVSTLLRSLALDLVRPILSAVLHKELASKVGPGSLWDQGPLEWVIHASDSWSWLLSP